MGTTQAPTNELPESLLWPRASFNVHANGLPLEAIYGTYDGVKWVRIEVNGYPVVTVFVDSREQASALVGEPQPREHTVPCTQCGNPTWNVEAVCDVCS